MATTIKVSERTRDRVNALGARTRQSADQVVDRALTEYDRALFWEEFAAAAQATEHDPHAAAQERAENELWDAVTARDTASRG